MQEDPYARRGKPWHPAYHPELTLDMGVPVVHPNNRLTFMVLASRVTSLPQVWIVCVFLFGVAERHSPPASFSFSIKVTKGCSNESIICFSISIHFSLHPRRISIYFSFFFQSCGIVFFFLLQIGTTSKIVESVQRFETKLWSLVIDETDRPLPSVNTDHHIW